MQDLRDRILVLLFLLVIFFIVFLIQSVNTLETNLKVPQEILLSHPEIQIERIEAKDQEESKMIQSGGILANKLLASTCFKDMLREMRFTETRGLKNEEIYDYLRAKPIKLNVQVYSGNFIENDILGVIGFFTPLYPEYIFQNRHYIVNSYEAAPNILHEAMHLMGFRHNGALESSVPYGMDALFFNCGSKLGEG